MSKPKLKVGILLDSKNVPAWTYRILESIANSDYACLSLIVVADRKTESLGFLDRLWKNRSKLVFFVYSKLDGFLFRSDPDAFEIHALGCISDGVDEISVTPDEEGFSDYFPDDAIATIKYKEIDVLLRFGFRILRGRILAAAKHGVWSYHHGDNRKNRGGPAGFWEVLKNWPETGSMLQILTEQLDGGRVLYRSWSRTNPYSVTENKNSYYWKSSTFVMRSLRRLYTLGAEKYFASIEQHNTDLSFYDRPLYRVPGNLQTAYLVARQLVLLARRVIEKLIYIDQWYLVYKFSDGKPATTLHQFKHLMPATDRFWADPFVIEKGGKYYVFFEEYLQSKGMAHISVMELDRSGISSEVTEVLVRPYHVSYPSLFEWHGRLFMVPETSVNKTIELYECTDFPNQWEFVHNIMEDVDAVDSTMLEHNGKWWLFSGWAEVDGMSHDDELCIFYADSPLSQDWQPHALNPVVSDVKNARPAGQIKMIDGRLLRPSQNCAGIYGFGFNLNEISILTEDEFEEVPIAQVTPDWDKKLTRTHTYNHTGDLTIGDAMKQRWKFF